MTFRLELGQAVRHVYHEALRRAFVSVQCPRISILCLLLGTQDWSVAEEVVRVADLVENRSTGGRSTSGMRRRKLAAVGAM